MRDGISRKGETGMDRPENPYQKGTLIWTLMEGGLQGEFDGKAGFEDMTIREIADMFETTYSTVQATLQRIKKETGFRVPRRRAARGGEEDE